MTLWYILGFSVSAPVIFTFLYFSLRHQLLRDRSVSYWWNRRIGKDSVSRSQRNIFFYEIWRRGYGPKMLPFLFQNFDGNGELICIYGTSKRWDTSCNLWRFARPIERLLVTKRVAYGRSFIRCWNIKKSETETLSRYGIPIRSAWEPKNNSTEIGIKLAVKYWQEVNNRKRERACPAWSIPP